MRNITYAIDTETGFVISRVNSEVLIPILDFEGMKPKNNWEVNYNYEQHPVNCLAGCWHHYTWTKKIPKDIKNLHRKFWGFKELK